MHRRNKVFEKYTLISDWHKQFRLWRAWTIIVALVAAVSFFVTTDWRWHVGSVATTAAFGYQTFVCYNKWKDAQREADSFKLGSSTSQEHVAEKLKTASVTPGPSSSTTQSSNNNLPITQSNRKDTDKQTPSTVNSIRRRFPRGQFDEIQSPDNHPENFSPDLARKFARQVMQSPGKLSPMNPARGSSNNRFSAFPATPSMDNEIQERKTYHISPLVTDTGKRNISSAEPRRLDALQTIGINSVPDEWVEKLKGNLGAHLYAILKLHDQSVQIIKNFLRQQQEQKRVPADTLAKVSPLLEHEVTYKSVTLEDGTVLTLDAILQFCAQPIAPTVPASAYSFNMPRPNPPPGVAEDVLQKYKASWSFFKLCRHIQEIIQQRPFPETIGASLAAGSNSDMLFGVPFADSMTKANSTATSSHRTTLMERLRQLQSSDRILRIEWQSMSFSRGGFGFGGRNTRDFISGHQEYEMMDQDIVMALFLHRCDDHQTRIITTSTSQPHNFSDMHFVCHAEDARQVLQHYHQELANGFDGAARTGSLSSNSRRLSSSPGGISSSARDSTSQLLNIMLRNYPHPVDETTSGSTGALASTGNAKLTQSGRSNSPHYDILRFASHVTHPSQLSQQSWQQISSIMATMSSSASHASGAGIDGESASMYLSWFPQYKEILTIESGRNDVFEAIIFLMLIMTLTAPANDLEDEPSRGNNGNADSVTIEDNLPHHHNALHHIMSLLEGNKKVMMGSEDRATVMMKLRRVFKLKGMGNGAGSDARVVRGLFEEVIDVHELRHMMYDFHNLQLLQQQQTQQQQQQLLSQSGLSVSVNQSNGVFSAPSSNLNPYSPFGSATKPFTGRLSSSIDGSSSAANHLLLLDGYGASSTMADSQQSLSGSSSTPFRRTGANFSTGHTPMWSGVSPAAGSSSSVLGGGAGHIASPLYSPPTGTMVFGRGNTAAASSAALGSGFVSQSLDVSMTPFTPGGIGSSSGMQGSALRGFNSSFSQDMSFSSVLGKSEKSRLTPFAHRY
jgi:hypothetical protein